MENDLLKIKEDAIKIQEADLLDTIKSVEAENTKSSFALIFASALIALLKDFDKLPLWVNVFFLVLAIGSIIFALYNISAKKVSVHANVDEIFVKNIPTQWEEHLQNKHLFLRNSYQEAKKLLYAKANLTRISFVLVALSTILISIAKIFL
jgi:preprotein translocase subunit SecE